MTSNEVTWTNPDATTIPTLLRDAAARWPDKIYLDFSGDEYSFAQVDTDSSRLARGLAAMGIGCGDTVCCLLDTSIDSLLVWFAVAKTGGVMVPINTGFRGEFLRHQIADSGAAVVIVDSGYAQSIAAIEDDIPNVRMLVYRGARPDAATRLELRSLDSLRQADGSSLDREIKPSDLAALIYTSGTTGPSKGCMLSHNFLHHAGIRTLRSQGLGRDDVLWLALPLFHLAAVCVAMACLSVGTTLSIYPRFSVSRFWEEIARSKATAVFALASMFPLIADAPSEPAMERCHGQLRVVFGVPFPPSLQARWKERFGVAKTCQVGYGMTEISPVATHPGPDHVCPPGSSGRPLDCLDVRIVDENDREVPRGTPGEVVVRPKIPLVMFDGYWKQPEETARAVRGLWFHCGDIGKIDAEGYFYFVDRKKDYLRYRGENISSFEVETTFRAHPDVADVAVHAVPSQLSEDDVKATLIMRDGFCETAEGLCRWAMERLPFFAVPRYIEFRRELPRNAVGRVLKYELRAEGVTAATWDREAAGLRVARG